jgi:NAD-dependent DNA ligase
MQSLVRNGRVVAGEADELDAEIDGLVVTVDAEEFDEEPDDDLESSSDLQSFDELELPWHVTAKLKPHYGSVDEIRDSLNAGFELTTINGIGSQLAEQIKQALADSE